MYFVPAIVTPVAASCIVSWNLLMIAFNSSAVTWNNQKVDRKLSNLHKHEFYLGERNVTVTVNILFSIRGQNYFGKSSRDGVDRLSGTNNYIKIENSGTYLSKNCWFDSRSLLYTSSDYLLKSQLQNSLHKKGQSCSLTEFFARSYYSKVQNLRTFREFC